MSWLFGHHATGSKRREFHISSELNGKVLDIRGGNAAAGTEVLMYHMKSPPGRNQLWYLDQQGCIRSVLNDMVFYSPEVGHPLKMQPASEEPGSHWRFDGEKIVNDQGQCLDIRGASSHDGAELCAYQYANHKNQHWRQMREFYIVSEMNNLVLDIKGAHSATGAAIVMYKKNSPPSLNQLWYMDEQGLIFSALNDFVFYAGAKGHELKMAEPGSPHSQWRIEGQKIVNGEGECLDIRGDSSHEGAELCPYEYKNKKNQHWRLEYV